MFNACQLIMKLMNCSFLTTSNMGFIKNFHNVAMKISFNRASINSVNLASLSQTFRCHFQPRLPSRTLNQSTVDKLACQNQSHIHVEGKTMSFWVHEKCHEKYRTLLHKLQANSEEKRNETSHRVCYRSATFMINCRAPWQKISGSDKNLCTHSSIYGKMVGIFLASSVDT